MTITVPAIPGTYTDAPLDRRYDDRQAMRKRPIERLDFDYDFANRLPSGDSIAQVSAVVASGDVTVDGTQYSSTKAKVWVSGGLNGETAGITVEIASALGEVVQAALIIRVIDPGVPVPSPTPDGGVAWVRLRWRDAYDPNETYYEGDGVNYLSETFLALRGSKGIAPNDDGTYWSKLGGKGDQGNTGATGTAASIALGTITTGAPGTAVVISDSGTPGASVLNFTIPRGDVGPQGIQGIQGATGTNGNTIETGTGAPASGTGVNGDFYIDTAANKIYGPKTGGAWGAGTNIVGPQGIQGIQGATGLTGVGLVMTLLTDAAYAALAPPSTGVLYLTATGVTTVNMTALVYLTAVQYAALAPPDANTLYAING